MRCLKCGEETLRKAQFCRLCETNFPSDTVTNASELPMVGLGLSIRRGFSNYFNFRGRARRSEYWFWILFTILVGSIPIIGPLLIIALYMPSITVTTRRLHDIEKSGWWQLGVFIPWTLAIMIFYLGVSLMISFSLVAFSICISLVCFAWLARKGDSGPNKYGPDSRFSVLE